MNKAFEKYKLDGKTALITGAAGLLGVQHAAALLESGAAVVMTDVNMTALQSAFEYLSDKFSTKNLIIKFMDVSCSESVSAVAAEIRAEGLDINILVNNAAIDPKVGGGGILETSRLEHFLLEQWNQEIAVGLTGAFICSQVFGSEMASGGKGGVILNISSDLSVFSPDQRLYRKDNLAEDMQPVKPITYSVIKAGLIGLTRYLATYWVDKNIRCNALSPGGILNGQSEEFVGRLTQLIPLGRMASYDEYCAAVQFLCSDASAYLNGQNIVMDGGRCVW